jgi:hypothetical protein
MTTANTKWKLEGDYFEGCNCDSIDLLRNYERKSPYDGSE